MAMTLFNIEKSLWFCTGIYWLLAAFNVRKAIVRQNDLSRIAYMCLWIISFSLLFSKEVDLLFLFKPVLPQQFGFKITGLILCIFGLCFSVWARICLGKNWSGRITIKKEHELIKTGPYSISRNPIYTGFLVAFIGCAMTEGLFKGYFSLLFLVGGISIKIKKEEVFMNQVFTQEFLMYKKKVKRLLPFIY
jgi:protein-S-isoprenylcysteine O-methyltransferase Ste14